MRKVALLVAVAMAVSASTSAFAAAKKKAAAPPPPPPNPNEPGQRFMSNLGQQIFVVPWQSMMAKK
jgi:Spy/CpxP family protein refolding chaperone